MTFGVDYAWGRPGVKALTNAGVQFAARYLSPDTTGKNLDRAEAQALSSAGIWILVVWESTASRALDGYAAGHSDALEAARQATACGMPSDRPIYFAVDFDASPGDRSAILAYLAGAASVLGERRVGLYAGFYPIKWAFDAAAIGYGWQTYAWSGGQWDHRAQLHQYSNDHIIGGVDLDYDTGMTGDYGQWKIGVSPSPAPTPQEDDDMPYGQLADGPQAITPISLPKGRYKSIGFTCDNGLQQLPPAKLRVAVQDTSWNVHYVDVDSTKGQTVVTFPDPANTVGISVRREDGGTVHVAWDVS